MIYWVENSLHDKSTLNSASLKISTERQQPQATWVVEFTVGRKVWEVAHSLQSTWTCNLQFKRKINNSPFYELKEKVFDIFLP